MDNKKVYSIVIEGVEKSISQVDALSDSLQFLDKKIKEMESRTVNVQSTTSNGGSSRVSELKTEDQLMKQIQKTEQEIANTRREDYQRLLAEKDILKEAKDIQEQRAASERLTSANYANTMKGMKQELADIKSVMQTTDLGSEEFDKLTKRAGELTQKLKDIEAAYGQFGRNVGNYASAAEGFQKFTIQVGDSAREFSTAREALKQLKQEMQTLTVKQDLGLISEEEAKRLESLIPTVKRLESTIQDAGKPMDDLMDSMQSLVAIAQAGKGLSALFGFDNDKIEESIQKLVALQNVMQSLQKLQKQMIAGDGLFGALKKANTAIDAMTKKLLGATKAAKGLSAAMKTIGVGAVVAVIFLLMDAFDDLEEKEKKAEEEAEKLKAQIDEQRQTFVNATAQYLNTASRISHLRDEYTKTNDQLKKTTIIKEATSEFKKLGMAIKDSSDAERILVEQGVAVSQLLRTQGQLAALTALRMEAFKKSLTMLLENGYDVVGATFLASSNERVQEFDKAIDKTNENLAELTKNLKINSDANDKNNSSLLKAEETYEDLRLRLMDNSLIKKLNQLDKEKTNTLAKVKGTQKEILQIERMYNDLRLKEIQNYVKQVEKQYDTLKESVVSTENQIKKSIVNASIAETEYESNLASTTRAIQNTIVSVDEYNEKIKGLVKTYGSLEKVQERIDIADTFNGLRDKPKGEQFFLNEWLNRQSKELQKQLLDLWNSLEGTAEHKTEVWLASLREVFTSEYAEELRLIKDFGVQYNKSLTESVLYRLKLEKVYKKGVLEERMALQQELLEKEKELAVLELQEAQKAALNEYNSVKKNYEEQITKLQEVIENIGALGANATKEQLKEFYDAKQKLEQIEKDYKDTQIKAQENYASKVEQNAKEYNNKIKEIELKRNSEIAAINASYYQEQLQNYRDFQTRFNEEIQKQPTYDNLGFGVVNIAKTKKSYKELQTAVKVSLDRIKIDREQLNDEFKKGLITPEVYNQTLRELNDMETSFKNTAKDVAESIKNIGVEFWSSINDWIQQIGQATTSILSSLSEIASNEYDWLISEQEKYINEYEELLNKQEQITQDHADKVNSIEDELSTARGDRRQQLVDALNAEMAAQRASLAHEKMIEKEKEKAEEKKKKLEHEQAVKKKEMDLWQARINAAMAVSMAAVNNWPIPAIPMMAMAAAVGAAQIAAVRSQNVPEYAEGGIIQGRSHAEGGVPVLGGRASVEGGEFITNKQTTASNVELLEFINTKKKRVNLEDMIEFYGGSVKKTIRTARTKFEDGGIIPTLRTDISINDRLLTAFEDYSNRNVVVSVVDINDRQAAVKNVQVLSGLEG